MASRKGRRGGKRTPLMEQYFRAKAQYPDAILFFRLGDFYEMFFDDAVEASKLLDLTLTSRGETPEGERIPMAGVPWHAASGYVARLLEAGRKVALCEQMADPSKVRGIVPREVVRVITPGLCLEPDALDARRDNYLVALVPAGEQGVGLAALELSRAELRAATLRDEASVVAELGRLEPRELLLPEGEEEMVELAHRLGVIAVRFLSRERLQGAEGRLEASHRLDEDETGAEIGSPGRAAAALALDYARENQPRGELPVVRVVPYELRRHLVLDEAVVAHLELVRTGSGERRGSLIHLLDRTRTAMGARLLRRWLLQPLCDVAMVRRRHDAVEHLLHGAELRGALREALAEVSDLERLATRLQVGAATPRDLGALRDGLLAADRVARVVAESRALASDPLAFVRPEDLVSTAAERLAEALVEEPPVATHQGGIFAEGFDDTLDELRTLSSRSREVLLDLERRERERTGIASLKLKYSRVFGYALEVTKANLHLVPDDYRRKQTIAGGERFVTDELLELQEAIEHAEERARRLEQERFEALRNELVPFVSRIRMLASRLAALDVVAALADVAHEYAWCRPRVDDSLRLHLREARHPVVEAVLPPGSFVPNDVSLDAEGERLWIVTGPNMAGKSTVLRQTALAVVLAQMGSFVPAASAHVGLVDRIFTRVGASDELSKGRSTFMVEMQETASMLKGAGRRALVVLDEIGRGTSTYDGLAIAWAVAEHLHDVIGCRALFATHYHELCELAETREGVANVNVSAREHEGRIVFLHRLERGGANRSYGIAVARLAGVPEPVLARARSILQRLERGEPLPSGGAARLRPVDAAGRAQLELFAPTTQPPPELVELQQTFASLSIERLTPLEALTLLDRLVRRARGEREKRVEPVTAEGAAPERPDQRSGRG